MFYINYNDYELLYLIKEGSENAYILLDKKYYSLIIKIAKSLRVKDNILEDIIEDGRIKLLEAINKYNTAYTMSFYSYFSLILTRMIIAYYKKSSYIAFNNEVPLIKEDLVDYNSKGETLANVIRCSRMINFKDVITKRIFDECIVEGLSIKGFSKKYNQEYSKMRYKYNYLLNEIKKILTIG